jgi:CheY-like chemotaxis protein
VVAFPVFVVSDGCALSFCSCAGQHFQDKVISERERAALQQTLAAERDAVQQRTKAERAVVLSDGLRQAQRLLVDFVSHKLRQPLHLLQNTVETLCTTHTGDYFDALSLSTAEVSRLARELVLHHELAAGVQETTVQSVNVAAFLGNAKHWSHSKFSLAGDAQIDPVVPESVPMDALWARESLFCLFRLLDYAEKLSENTISLHATILLAPKVTNDDLVRHRNVFTSALWLDRCEEITSSSNLPPELADTAEAPKAPATIVKDDADGVGWFLQMEVRATGFATCTVLRELARPMPDDVQPVARPPIEDAPLQSLSPLELQPGSGQQAAAPIYATSTRMDLRLAKLAAGVLRGRIGILVESNDSTACLLTRLVLQIPMPWASTASTQAANMAFPCPFDLLQQDPVDTRATPSSGEPQPYASPEAHNRSPQRILRSKVQLATASIGTDISTALTPTSSAPGSMKEAWQGEMSTATPCSNTTPSPAERDSSPCVNITGTTIRALVVDDEGSIRKLHCRLLHRLGFACDAVDDGDQVHAAVDAAAMQGRPYDAVLMDLVMKRVHGDQACAALRQSGYKGAILAATANANPSDQERLVRMGFTSVLCKPFSLPQLKSTLAACGFQLADKTDAKPTEDAPVPTVLST